MKQTIRLIILFTALSIIKTFAQETKPLFTEADWNSIIPHLQSEHWKEVEKISEKLLKKSNKDNEDNDDAAIMRYMYLCSIGGQVGNKEIDKDAALKKVKPLTGRKIITPFCVFKSKGMFNFFSLSEEKDAWGKCFANDDATIIYMFEHYEVANKALLDSENLSKLEGKPIRVSARIKDIKAGGFAMPRLEVTYSESDVWDMDTE